MELNDKKPNFSFEKKLVINSSLYGNHIAISEAINRLMVCMKETNQKYGVQCEFFRLDFRQPYFDENIKFPDETFILHLKWGSKKELENTKEKSCENT